MPVWSTETANELITLSIDEGNMLTHMQIQKLTYISHGWSLIMHDHNLTIDSPEAWRFGPVYRLLWDALKYAGNYPITTLISDSVVIPYAGAMTGAWSVEDKDLLKEVHRVYGKLGAFKLSRLTHQKGTPWDQVYAEGKGRDLPIPAAMIKQHFSTFFSKDTNG